MKPKYQLTKTEINWIVMALQHEIAEIKHEMDAAEDGSPVQSLGEIAIGGRESLITKLNDALSENAKIIAIN